MGVELAWWREREAIRCWLDRSAKIGIGFDVFARSRVCQ